MHSNKVSYYLPDAGEIRDVDSRPGITPVLVPVPEGDEEEVPPPPPAALTFGDDRVVLEEEEVRVGELMGLKLTVTVPEPSSSSTTPSSLLLLWVLLPCTCACPPSRFDTNYNSSERPATIETC